MRFCHLTGNSISAKYSLQLVRSFSIRKCLAGMAWRRSRWLPSHAGDHGPDLLGRRHHQWWWRRSLHQLAFDQFGSISQEVQIHRYSWKYSFLWHYRPRQTVCQKNWKWNSGKCFPHCLVWSDLDHFGPGCCCSLNSNFSCFAHFKPCFAGHYHQRNRLEGYQIALRFLAASRTIVARQGRLPQHLFCL